jgi:beta propeller repeat protein
VEPDVSGNIIVWRDHREEIGWDIWGVDLTTGTEFPICTNEAEQSAPAIEGGLVVWVDMRNGDPDIYGYDLAKGVEFPICIAPGEQSFPAISGSLVVWDDNRSGPRNIYGAYIPEPATLALLAAGGVLALRRRARHNRSARNSEGDNR